MRVLVVEDEEISGLVLTDSLRDLGYDVELALDGEEGWQRYQTGEFQVLIVDWMMPRLDGVSLCRRIRESGSGAYTYLVLLTGRTEREDRLEALESGADDFLTKPVDPGELRARLSGATRILQSESALRKANEELQRASQLQAELGSEIQRTLLLGTPPTEARGIAISSLTMASKFVAGDFVDFYPHASGITDIVAGDVMGKGIPAAMVAAGVKSAIEKSLVRLMGSGYLPRPTDVLKRVARIAVKELIELDTFVTLCYVRIDGQTGGCTFVNCGHPHILRWIAAEDRCELLKTSTVPMGFLENDTFPETDIQLGAGDLLLIYSDGITDLLPEPGKPLGQDGLLEIIQECAHQPLDQIVEKLRDVRDKSFAGDDVTCVAIRICEQHLGERTLLWSENGAMKQVRDAIRLLSQDKGKLSEAQVSELILGVQEAGSNAMRHARPLHKSIPIAFEVIESEKGVKVELRYPGIQFDPRITEPVEFDLEREGGFGLAIINRCADNIEYKYSQGWNILSLEKWVTE